MQKVSTNALAGKKAKRKSISYDKYGYLFVAPFVIVFLVFQKYFTKGITMGAVKG